MTKSFRRLPAFLNIKTFSIVLALAATLLLTGCIGLGFMTYGKRETLNTTFSLNDRKNQIDYYSKTIHIYTEEEIIARWGQPDSVKTTGACKVLIYNNGRSWAGAIVQVIVIPVPLMLPTGHYKNRFYMRDGKCVGLIVENGFPLSIFGYFSFSENELNVRFYFGKDPDGPKGPRKVPVDFCK